MIKKDIEWKEGYYDGIPKEIKKMTPKQVDIEIKKLEDEEKLDRK